MSGNSAQNRVKDASYCACASWVTALDIAARYIATDTDFCHILVVGASDWHTTAWLDGNKLGENKGGYTPFEFEQYELLPKKGYPITDPHWPNADAAYLTVLEEVDGLVEAVRDIIAG